MTPVLARFVVALLRECTLLCGAAPWDGGMLRKSVWKSLAVKKVAYLALWRAFKEDPNDAALRKELENAADAAKTWDELATAYEEELPRMETRIRS